MAVLTHPKGQSAHWYHFDGTPQHQMPLKDGDGFRNTTLADARKLRLYPSVSGILQVLGKPGLEKWKIKQAILATLRVPKAQDVSEDHYCSMIRDQANEQVEDAADFGSSVHHEIERFLHHTGDTPFVPSPELGAYVSPAVNWVYGKGIKIENPEKCMVNHEHGFAGTTDAPYRSPTAFGILDWKSKKTVPGKKIENYPEQVMQIASYFVTYWGEAALDQPNAWGGNIFISSTERGRCVANMYNRRMLKAAWSVFKVLCDVWRHFNEYDPRYDLAAQPVWDQAMTIEISQPGELPMVTPPPTPPVHDPLSAFKDKVVPESTPTVQERTILEILKGASCNHTADGIDFLTPEVCAGFTPGRIKTIYAWWYHKETNTAKVSLFGDGSLREHGWINCMFAYPKDLDMVNRAEGKPDPVVGTNGLPVKPTPEVQSTPVVPAKVNPNVKAVDDGERLKQLESMKMGFGKHKSDFIRDVPSSYLDWLRGQLNKETFKCPAFVREYLERKDVNASIDQDLKRADR